MSHPAASGSEFSPSKGSVMFPEGTVRRTVTTLVRSDAVPELNETFFIRMVNVTGMTF